MNETSVRRIGLGALAGLAFCVVLAVQNSAVAAFTPGSVAPSNEDQYMLELINRFRGDPQGELARTVTNDLSSITRSSSGTAGDGTPWSAGFWTGGAAVGMMNFFQVDPGDLTYQWDNLPAGPLYPLAWNLNLASTADQYNDLMIADAGATANPHEISPYIPFDAARYTDSGYTGISTAGESIFRDYVGDLDFAHAAFAVDWGGTPNGIQNPPGHRNNYLSTTFTEIGIDVKDSYTAGRQSLIQEFGDRFAGDEFLVGVVYNDDDIDSFYSIGEGIGNTLVEIFASGDIGGTLLASGSTWGSGGYTIDVTSLSDADYDVRFSLGGVNYDTTFSKSGSSVKLDAINVVPEPSTLSLTALALLGLIVYGWRRKP